METKELQYFFDGLSDTVGGFLEEVYETLVQKGKKKMGQETGTETPQISELIRRTREQQSIADLVAKGKKGQEELIQSIGSEVKRKLSAAGIVTKTDLARLDRRVDEIEKILTEKEESK